MARLRDPKIGRGPAEQKTKRKVEKAEDGRDPSSGQFTAGNRSGRGRAPGSRSKLAEDTISALQQVFEDHGIRAMEEMAMEKPEQFVRTVVGLLPKKVEVERKKMTDAELIADIKRISAELGITISGLDDPAAEVRGVEPQPEAKPAGDVPSVH